MKRLARETREDPVAIIGATTNHLPEYLAHKLPSVGNLKRTIQQVRHQHNGPVRQPANLNELMIQPNLALFENGEEFLIFDNGVNAGNQRYVNSNQVRCP